MPSSRCPPDKRILPSNTPDRDVVGEWKHMYRRLREGGYRQTKAIDEISKAYGVNFTTVRYHLLPRQKEKQNKRPSQQWGYRSSRPDFSREAFNADMSSRQAARRNIEGLVQQAFTQAEPQAELSIQEITDAIFENTRIRFRPSSLITLNMKYSARYGHPLITPVPDTDPIRYLLSTDPNHSLTPPNRGED